MWKLSEEYNCYCSLVINNRTYVNNKGYSANILTNITFIC